MAFLTINLTDLPEVGPNWLAEMDLTLQVESAGVQFLEDGGDPWAVLAGEHALLGREISSLEVARDLLALT